MAVRLECRDLRPVGRQIKVLCGSAERNNPATKNEPSRSVARANRMNPRPNRQGIAKIKWIAYNQHGEAVYTFTPIGIVPRRPA
jgi:hypothetical protein